MGVSVNLVTKSSFIDLETVQANWNVNDLQLIIRTQIKLTSTLESDLMIKITKVRF